MKNILLGLLIVVSLSTVSCGKETDVDKVGDAQLCLDKLGSSATTGEVNECLQKIDGIESAAAYGLRCAGAFMKEGFLSSTKLTNAMNQLSGGGGTSNFMSLITFYSGGNITKDTSNSYDAFNYCLKGEGKGSTLIASFAYVAMAIYQYMSANDSMSDCSTTPTASGYPFNTCASNWSQRVGNAVALANLVDSTASATASAQSVQSSIGAVLISTSNLSCGTKFANQDLCSKVNGAITAAGGKTNARLVAVKFFTTSVF